LPFAIFAINVGGRLTLKLNVNINNRANETLTPPILFLIEFFMQYLKNKKGVTLAALLKALALNVEKPCCN
jgi:hypothetical protein